MQLMLDFFEETFLDCSPPYLIHVYKENDNAGFFIRVSELDGDEYIEMLQEIENMCARELKKMENSLDGCLE